MHSYGNLLGLLFLEHVSCTILIRHEARVEEALCAPRGQRRQDQACLIIRLRFQRADGPPSVLLEVVNPGRELGLLA